MSTVDTCLLIIIFTLLLVLVVFVSFHSYVTHKFVNKIMARDYHEYVSTRTRAEVEKLEVSQKGFIPQEFRVPMQEADQNLREMDILDELNGRLL